MNPLRSMELFIAVAELGSFASAAVAHDLSPTMVANHVRALERRVGGRLIDRTTRRHTLTEIGRAYLERCRDALEAVSAADNVVDALRARPEGLLRITAPVSYGAHRLLPVVRDYLAEHPDVRIELSLSDRIIDLGQEGFDVGVRSGRHVDDGVVAIPVRAAAMRAVAAPAYLDREGRPEMPSELGRLNLLGFTPWGDGHDWTFERNGELETVRVSGSFSCDSDQALLGAALLGLGVIVQADALVDAHIDRGELEVVLPDWQLPPRRVFIVRRPAAYPSARMNTFVAFARARLT